MQKFSPSIVLFWCLLFLSCINQGEANSVLEKRKQLFNFDWKFSLENEITASELNSINQKNFDDSNWRTVHLPHDWSIEGRIDINNPSGNDGGYFPTGTGWYRKTFDVPKHWQGRVVNILFEGVYMNAEVFINGKSLGIYPYGYSSFLHDLTPYLFYGRENLIAVRVDNSQQKNSRWYSGSGIYRHVWLYVTEPIHLQHWGVQITTPHIHTNAATVDVTSVIVNATEQPVTLRIATLLSNSKKRSVGSEASTLTIAANSKEEVAHRVRVRRPKLWSPESPYLYTAEVTIQHNNRPTDALTTTFGIRSIHFSAEKGFQLNGKTVLLNGGNVHHDHGSLGAASFDRAEERKVELLKAAGFNAVRTSHNPFSPAFYEACNRLGLLVINESFDGWRVPKTPFDYALHFDTWWQKDIEAMVLRDRNHPSIILWSTGNEVLERTEPQAIRTAKMLAEHVRKLDPTRPVTSALTSWNQGWERFDSLFAVHDVGGYNYHLHMAESDHQRVPSRIILQTESYPKDVFFCWDMTRKHPYIIGDFVWTAMDYLGESGIGAYYYPGEEAVNHWVNKRFPWHGAYCGDIDLTGWRKPISHYRSMLWNQKPMLYLAVRQPNPPHGSLQLTDWAVWPTWESWTWPGHEHQPIEVEVYSKYEKVRLYLNNQFIDEKSTGYNTEFKTRFTIPYQPGVLKAVGVNGNKELESTQLETAGHPAKIRLSPDRKTISANGLDLSYITVEITDSLHRLVPNAHHRISFSIQGPATIAGIDNGNLRDTDPYQANNRRVFNGRAVIVLRSTRNSGAVTLTAHTPELPSTSVIITTQ